MRPSTVEEYYSAVNEKASWEEILKILNIGHKKTKGGSADICIKCIFHKELTPSLKFSSKKQIFHCFGCGFGGTKFSFIERFFNSRGRAIKFFRKHFDVYYPFLQKQLRQKIIPISLQIEYELFECCNEDWLEFLDLSLEIIETLNEIYLEQEGF